MNKKMKKLTALFAVLVVLSIVTVIVSRYEVKKEEIKTSGDTYISIDPDEVTAFSWSSDDSSMAFTKTEDTWTYDSDENFPVDQDTLMDLISNYEDEKAGYIIEDVTDYSQYGLDDPVLTVTITTEEGTTTFKYGDYSKMDSQRYVSIDDGNVYLVTNDMTETLDLKESDLIDNDETENVNGATMVTFEGAENYQFYYKEDTDYSVDPDDVYFVADSNLPLDSTLVKSYLKAITNLALTNYVTYTADTDDLSEYGLDDPYLIETIVYTEDKEEKTLILYFGQDAEDVKNEEEDPDVYLRINDSNLIYKLSASQKTSLTEVGYDDLRHKELMTADFDDITELIISLDEETYDLVKDGKKWTYLDEEVSMDDLEDELEDLSASTFTDESKSGKEEIAITVKTSNETYPEITISLQKNDADTCYATVNGEPFGYVARTSVVDLIEYVNAIVLK